jgi:hypothetical protein
VSCSGVGLGEAEGVREGLLLPLDEGEGLADGESVGLGDALKEREGLLLTDDDGEADKDGE